MSLSDYEDVWKRQKPPIGANADLEMLKDTFDTKHRKQAANLRVRDYAEGSAGLIVSIVFGFVWWQQGAAGWPMAFAIILMLFVSGVYVREHIRTRHQVVSINATMLEKVKHDLVQLRHQHRLFLTMWLWYLAPAFVAIYIVVYTISANRSEWHPLRSYSFHAGFMIFNVLIFWFVWFINRRDVRRQVEPRIAELEKLQQNLADQS